MVVFNKWSQLNSDTRTKIYMNDRMAPRKLAGDLSLRLKKHNCESPRILLCIGTDRSTGDCLGPLVGSKIDQMNQGFFEVYGTLNNPVHASNLKDTLEEINSRYKNPLIIAVDACLGRIENVGYINLGNGSLHPGAGVNKNLPPVGQIHITGIVNVGGFMEYMVLQNTRLNIVMGLADIIARGLGEVIAEYARPQSVQGC
ncbi:MAG: spore protease YyaC [Peptococcaceae bacterium]|nr:spore protease YyaC [Peptococcaceae bacterium]